jgi:hypothetical protein
VAIVQWPAPWAKAAAARRVAPSSSAAEKGFQLSMSPPYGCRNASKGHCGDAAVIGGRYYPRGSGGVSSGGRSSELTQSLGQCPHLASLLP